MYLISSISCKYFEKCFRSIFPHLFDDRQKGEETNQIFQDKCFKTNVSRSHPSLSSFAKATEGQVFSFHLAEKDFGEQKADIEHQEE